MNKNISYLFSTILRLYLRLIISILLFYFSQMASLLISHAMVLTSRAVSSTSGHWAHDGECIILYRFLG